MKTFEKHLKSFNKLIIKHNETFDRSSLPLEMSILNLLQGSTFGTTWAGGINKKHKLPHPELIKQLICLLLPFQPLFLQMSLIK